MDAVHYRHKCESKAFRADHVDAVVWEWVKGFLCEPDILRESTEALQELSQQETAPIRERIALIDHLIADNRRQLTRLLDLYLGGEFERDALTDRKTRLESTIMALEQENANLIATLEQKHLSDERIKAVCAFANNQQIKVELATRDFSTRRELIEALNVRATLVRENGEVVIYASCVLGEKRFSAESNTTSGTRRNIRYELCFKRTGEPGRPGAGGNAEQRFCHLPG
jgi:hypothetical protein